MTQHEWVNEEPGDADGDKHGEEDERKHKGPGRAWVGRRTGCLGWSVFLRIGHRSVYGDGYRMGREEPKRARRAAKSEGPQQHKFAQLVSKGAEVGGNREGSVADEGRANRGLRRGP